MLKTARQKNKRNNNNCWMYQMIGIIGIFTICVIVVIHNVFIPETDDEPKDEIKTIRELLATQTKIDLIAGENKILPPVYITNYPDGIIIENKSEKRYKWYIYELSKALCDNDKLAAGKKKITFPIGQVGRRIAADFINPGKQAFLSTLNSLKSMIIDHRSPAQGNGCYGLFKKAFNSKFNVKVFVTKLKYAGII